MCYLPHCSQLQVMTTAVKEKHRTRIVNRTAMPIFDEVNNYTIYVYT